MTESERDQDGAHALFKCQRRASVAKVAELEAIKVRCNRRLLPDEAMECWPSDRPTFLRGEYKTVAVRWVQNVRLFTEMFLSLGADAIKVAGSSHDSELNEARALAADRWSRLLDLESQVLRDAAALETRPKKRPPQHGDERIPDRTIAEWEASWDEQTKHMHAALGELRRLAERERAELESLTQRR